MHLSLHSATIKSAAQRKTMNKCKLLQERTVAFALLYVSYVAYYVCRKNYGFWLYGIVSHFSIPKTEVSLAGSSFEIASGVSKVALSFVVDLFSPSKVLAVALIISALINLLLCSTANIYMLALLWGTNGVVQSLGWPALSNIFMSFFPKPQERARWYSLLSTNQNVGSFLPAVIIPYATNRYGWKASMWCPSIVGLLVGVLLLIFLKDTPARTTTGAHNSHKRQTVGSKLIWRCVIHNRKLWSLAAAYFGISIIRTTMEDWAQTYMKEMYNGTAEMPLVALQVGGLIGSLIAAWLSDVVFRGLRAPVIAIFCLLSFVPVCLLSLEKQEMSYFFSIYFPILHPEDVLVYLPVCIYFLLGLTLFAPHVLIGLAAREWAPAALYSTSGGFVKMFAQIGGACAGTPVAYLIETYGWQKTFGSLSLLCIVSFVALVPVWSTEAYSPPIKKTCISQESEVKKKVA